MYNKYYCIVDWVMIITTQYLCLFIQEYLQNNFKITRLKYKRRYLHYIKDKIFVSLRSVCGAKGVKGRWGVDRYLKYKAQRRDSYKQKANQWKVHIQVTGTFDQVKVIR